MQYHDLFLGLSKSERDTGGELNHYFNLNKFRMFQEHVKNKYLAHIVAIEKEKISIESNLQKKREIPKGSKKAS